METKELPWEHLPEVRRLIEEAFENAWDLLRILDLTRWLKINSGIFSTSQWEGESLRDAVKRHHLKVDEAERSLRARRKELLRLSERLSGNFSPLHSLSRNYTYSKLGDFVTNDSDRGERNWGRSSFPALQLLTHDVVEWIDKNLRLSFRLETEGIDAAKLEQLRTSEFPFGSETEALLRERLYAEQGLIEENLEKAQRLYLESESDTSVALGTEQLVSIPKIERLLKDKYKHDAVSRKTLERWFEKEGVTIKKLGNANAVPAAKIPKVLEANGLSLPDTIGRSSI
ncbi:MAG: hypothetical protein ACE361_17000 [Aureliella sp.]